MINGDGVDDLTTPLLKMLHTVLHLTQVYGLPMEFYLPTID
jgi:hypothetical protein